MTALAKFSAAARGVPVIQQHTILPDTNTPGISVTSLFQFQSYFDDALLENAILTQSANEPIVGSTMVEVKIGGYALALHPSSQTPVAVQPMVGGSGASPAPIILRPGQIFRPHGMLNGRQGNFSTFRWGLPFGWLGGGMATIYVLPSPDASIDWTGENPEIIFHRQRMQITAAPVVAPFNWPMRFPWPNAARGATPIAQPGKAIIAVGQPTRVLMSLRIPSLLNPADMRLLFEGTNDFDLDSSGNVVSPPVRFVDYTWGSYAASGGGGNLATAYPVVSMPGEVVRLAADDGGVALQSTNLDIEDQYVDVVRYCIL